MWIFGYGSLMWRPGMAYEARKIARLGGWVRRFYQASPDHRGTPEAPGRVVTLLPDPEGHCWGAAYRVSAEQSQGILEQLDHREKEGYEHLWATLEVGHEGRLTGETLEALVYVAPPSNPNFVGPAPLAQIAQTIAKSVGPSGPNTEYLLELAQSLREIGSDDPHVFGLERALHLILKQEESP